MPTAPRSGPVSVWDLTVNALCLHFTSVAVQSVTVEQDLMASSSRAAWIRTHRRGQTPLLQRAGPLGPTWRRGSAYSIFLADRSFSREVTRPFRRLRLRSGDWCCDDTILICRRDSNASSSSSSPPPGDSARLIPFHPSRDEGLPAVVAPRSAPASPRPPACGGCVKASLTGKVPAYVGTHQGQLCCGVRRRAATAAAAPAHCRSAPRAASAGPARG